MARKRTAEETTPQEQAALDAASFADVEEVADAVRDQPERPPLMTDYGWHDHVMRQFHDAELDPDGRPNVAGLRRVAGLLLGPTLSSAVTVIQAPSLVPGFERSHVMQPAVVSYSLTFLWLRPEVGLEEPTPVTVCDVADCHYGNVDPNFVRFATATAATRAEARCLRKALRLRGVAAEEVTSVPPPPLDFSGRSGLDATQLSFIDILCRRCDIDAWKFINSGKRRYQNVGEIPGDVGVKMAECLSGYQSDPSKIPESIRGYKTGWRDER